MPNVSVIIPVFNTNPKYIKIAVDSVLNQTLKDIEIVIVNDGSTDKNTLNFLKKLKKPQIRIVNQKNLGLGGARNTGIEHAIGEYVGFLDSDDWIDYNFYEKLYDACKINQADVSCGVLSILNSDGLVQNLDKYNQQITNDNLTKIKNITNGSVCSKLFKKSLFNNNRFFEHLYYEDNPVLLRALLESKKVAYVPSVHYWYRQHETSIVHNEEFAHKRREHIFVILAEISHIMRKYPYFVRYAAESCFSKILLGISHYNKNKEYKKRIQHILKIPVGKKFFFMYKGNVYRDRLLNIFCKLFPIRKSKVIFNQCNGLGYGCNPKYITESMLKDKRFQIVWIIDNDKNIDYTAFPAEVKLVYLNSIAFLYHLCTSKFIISNVRSVFWNWYKKRKGQTYIQTWHGSMCFKKIEGDCTNLPESYIETAKEDSKNIDFLLSGSELRTKMCFNSHTFFYNGLILPYGFPRNDILFVKDNSFIKNKVKTYFNIPQDNIKICIYAPTFRDAQTLDVYKIDYNALNKALTRRFGGKWIIISRLHPNMVKIDNILPALNYVYDGSKYSDMQELLASSDVLITDYSGCAFDFMLTKRPIFIFATDIEAYMKERDFYIQLSDTPFQIATNNAELVNNIACFDYKIYKKNLKLFMEKVNSYDDGRASERFLTLLKEQR